MSRGRHLHGAPDARGTSRRFLSPVGARFVRGGTHSRRPKHVKAGDGRLRRFRSPIVLFVCAFVFASGTAAFAYTTTQGSGTGQAQAVALNAPGAGTASKPTTTSLSLSWGASSGLPQDGGYLILRSTSPTGPYAKDSSGTCNQTITVVSAATSCTDTGLTGATTYYYEVEAAYYDISTLWVSAPDAHFSGTTAQAASTPSPGPTGPAPTSTGAPLITSATSASFYAGSAGTFQATASGSPAPTFSNTAFTGCTPSVLPSGVTFSGTGLLSGTAGAAAAGTYTVCIEAANGVAPDATQRFTLTVATQALAISSTPVSGASSTTPNLGPITVRRQTGSGTPITSGALTVNLASTPSGGATFGTAQFAAAPVASVTIPSGQSTATFWFGSSVTGGPTLTASATGYVSGSQVETITAAPAGLGLVLAAGSTGSPVVSCGAPAATSTCTVTGVRAAGSVAFSVAFWNTGKSPVVYSATQASTVNETGRNTGSATIGAGASGSSAALTASVGTSTLTFGPYTLTITVGP